MMTFTLPPVPSAAPAPRQSSRLRSVLRVAGSALSWFTAAVSMVLFVAIGQSVAAIGGSCASGGAFEIAVPCPDDTVTFISIAVPLVFVSLFGLALAGGFGPSLAGIGWFALFGGLGAMFLVSYFSGVMSSGLLVGIVFVFMAIVPMWMFLATSPRWLLIGSKRATGERYYLNRKEFERLRELNPLHVQDLVAPRVRDWALALGVFAVSVAGGVAAASALVAVQ